MFKNCIHFAFSLVCRLPSSRSDKSPDISLEVLAINDQSKHKVNYGGLKLPKCVKKCNKKMHKFVEINRGTCKGKMAEK